MSFTRELLTEDDRSHLQPYGEKIIVSWTADSGGNYMERIPNMRGFLVKIKTGPGAVPPPALYDLKLFDATPGDLLGVLDELDGICSGLNGRSNTDQQQLPIAGSGIVILTYLNRDYDFSISGSGSGAQGICEFYLKNR